jgi:hypothetical protein
LPGVCDLPLAQRTIYEAADCFAKSFESNFSLMSEIAANPGSATIGQWVTVILTLAVTAIVGIPVVSWAIVLLVICVGLILRTALQFMRIVFNAIMAVPLAFWKRMPGSEHGAAE